MKKQTPFGWWDSPITTELITRSSPGYDYTSCHDGNIYWVENRPWEQGRNVIVQYCNGQRRDLLPTDYGARSKVHEYGGTPYLICDDTLVFINAADQHLYTIDLAQTEAGAKPSPKPLTSLSAEEHSYYSFADFCPSPLPNRIICVAEKTANTAEPENLLVTINLISGQINALVEGSDFYAYPRLSPCRRKLCWISWDHPNMPWDSTQLWCAQISKDNDSLLRDNTELLAGIATGSPTELTSGQQAESIFQPHWKTNGDLVFNSDREGWWNLYLCQYKSQHQAPQAAQALHPMQAESATPLWNLGMTTTVSDSAGNIYFTYTEKGCWSLGKLDITGAFQRFELPFVDIRSLSLNENPQQPDKSQLVFVGATATTPPAVIAVALNSRSDHSPNKFSVLSAPLTNSVDERWISSAQAITFDTTDNDLSHGFFYPPKNPNFDCTARLPPLIVICHGGPTGATSTALNYKIQFWTSRGFAVADINYRGSTGYGRDYREKLRFSWGIKDVEDVVSAANYLIESNRVNPDQVLIRGSSAGGYTVLAALAFHDLFKGGACLYGIGNLETLAQDTHKFEARYLDSLVGPYPEEQAKYQRLSPIHSVEQITCPVIFQQGLLDKVVPPEQAESMVKALSSNGVKTHYVTFADEGHGFRVADNIDTALSSELAFYQNTVLSSGD